MSIQFLRSIAMAFIVSLGLMGLSMGFSSTPAEARAACKGLSKTSCSSRDDCVHVGSYTTKAGNRVQSYCRNKGGNGASKSKPSKSKTTRKTRTKADTKSKAKDTKAKGKSKAKSKAKSKGKSKAKKAKKKK